MFFVAALWLLFFTAQQQVVISPSIPPGIDNVIVAGPNGVPKSSPSGFRLLLPRERTTTISKIARSLLGGKFGTITLFSIGDKHYLARVEPHYHKPPPPNTSKEDLVKYPRPWGWHHGITVYCPLN